MNELQSYDQERLLERPETINLLGKHEFNDTKSITPSQYHFTRKGLSEMMAQIEDAEKKFLGKVIVELGTQNYGKVILVTVDHPVEGLALICETREGKIMWVYAYKARVVRNA
jgi:hypothetical protein